MSPLVKLGDCRPEGAGRLCVKEAIEAGGVAFVIAEVQLLGTRSSLHHRTANISVSGKRKECKN